MLCWFWCGSKWVYFYLREVVEASIIFFHSTVYVYFDSAFICSFWREICVQLDFDFEQCQIRVGDSKTGKNLVKREIKKLKLILWKNVLFAHFNRPRNVV